MRRQEWVHVPFRALGTNSSTQYRQLQVPEPLFKNATFFPENAQHILQRLHSTTTTLNYVKPIQKTLFDMFYNLRSVWTFKTHWLWSFNRWNFIIIDLGHDFHENLKMIFDLLGLSRILGLSNYKSYFWKEYYSINIGNYMFKPGTGYRLYHKVSFVWILDSLRLWWLDATVVKTFLLQVRFGKKRLHFSKTA